MITPQQLHTLLTECIDAQQQATEHWHTAEPQSLPEPSVQDAAAPETLKALVLAQHWRNFQLWHVEDIARRRDVTPDTIADCKYRIDKLNQERNDRMERVDACLLALLDALLPNNGSGIINTESAGMAVDRLSILSLKVWHMREQTERTDVSAEHVASCEGKLAILKEQRADLAKALHHLLDEFMAGTRCPKVYFQFKMYNDPALNPELYKNG